jgi:hypothetical protein
MENSFFQSFFIIAAIIVITLVLSRILVRRRITKMMMDKSVGQNELASPVLFSKEEEVAAVYQPIIKMVDYNTDLQKAIATRDKLIAGAQQVFKRAMYTDLLVGVGYLFIPTLVSLSLQFMFQTPSSGSFAFVSNLGLPFAFISIIRYLGFKTNFRVYHKGIGGVLQPIKKIWLTIADPKWSGYITILILATAMLAGLFSLFSADGLGLILAASFHLWLIRRFKRSLESTSNLKLLVLRVFGINETATFTFEGLLQYWQYFGSWFTIVDPSFLRSSVRQRNQILPMVSLAFFLLIFLGVILGSAETFSAYVYLIIIPVIIIAGYSYTRYSLNTVDKSFIKSKADLDNRLAQLDKSPRELNYTFKSMPTMCHDNTWKLAVAEYAHRSEVILMDLRGFSEERKGCEYEVDFLFDYVPASKLVFLVDSDGFALTEKLINERWENQHPDSPNLTAPNPEIQVYVSSQENNKDIQGIMDVLLNTV